jgi:hypothetical protein
VPNDDDDDDDDDDDLFVFTINVQGGFIDVKKK